MISIAVMAHESRAHRIDYLLETLGDVPVFMDEVARACEGHKILSVDDEISRAVLKAGLKIRLMKGMYVLHYYRLREGEQRKKLLR